MSAHRCHAPGCQTPAVPELPFCLAHWLRCPSSLQFALWRCWYPTHEVARKLSAECADVMRRAVDAVARLERAP
jgi:predicted LPLAT superfamily acyltransferase